MIDEDLDGIHEDQVQLAWWWREIVRTLFGLPSRIPRDPWVMHRSAAFGPE
jgi:hypothetical protein